MDAEARYRAQFAGKPIENTGRTGGFAAPTPKKVAAPIKIAGNRGLPGPLQKISDVSTQLIDAAGTVVGKTAKYAANVALDVGRAALGSAKTFVDYQAQPIQNKLMIERSKQLDQVQDSIILAYKSGKMSKDDYSKALINLSGAYQDVSNETRKVSNGPTPIQRATDVAETAVNILSTGSFQIYRAGGKQAFEAAAIGTTKALDRNAIKALVDEAATGFEKALFKAVPASRALVERNLMTAAKREAQQLAGESAAQFLARESKRIAIGLLVKRPLFYQTNVGGGKDVYTKIMEGNYPAALRSSAWLAAQMIEGGPLGLFAKGASYLKGKLGTLATGRLSYIDELSKEIGTFNASQGQEYINSARTAVSKRDFTKGFFDPEMTARIAQETNLRATNNDVKRAVENTLSYYDQAGVERSELTIKEIFDDLNKWASADAALVAHIKNGKITGYGPEDLEKLAVVRWDSVMKGGLAKAVLAAGDDKTAQLKAIIEMSERPGIGFGANNTLMKRLQNIVKKSNSADEAAKAIKEIETASVASAGVSKSLRDSMSKLGYIIAEPHGGNKIPRVDYQDIRGTTRKLVSAATDGNTDIYDPAIAPHPAFETLKAGLSKAGLSPEAASEVGSRKLSEAVVANLNEAAMSKNLGIIGGDTVNGGRAVLSRLQEYIEAKPAAFGLGKSAAVTDIRQLRYHEVAEALGITKQQARGVYDAILKGYRDVPMEFRGLGDKIVDTLYTVNPLHKHYSRIQSAMRYTYNPFFRTQERVETTLLGRAQAGNPLWHRPRAVLEDTVKKLEDSRIFSSSFSGQAAEDQVIGRITANITGGQKRSLAGLALDMADARGLTMEQMLSEHSDEIDDALRVVVQYPRKGIIASPLARTVNVMFFPMRYNAKVTGLIASVLAKQPPTVQLAVLHSGFKMKEWLKSDEGIAWQGAHADAIQVFGWLTPINSISYTLNLLSHGVDTPAELGVLGGLPLGFITQILDSQGVIHLNRPYVNPKTGDVLPKYIPKSAEARASVAIIDILGSMFTYPGRTLGLPGKNATLKKIVNDFITTNGSDFEKRLDEDRLTPLQKNWVRVLKGDLSEEAIDNLYNSPAPGQFNGYTLPPLALPVRPKTRTVPKRTGLPSRSSTSRGKKKALPIPQRA